MYIFEKDEPFTDEQRKEAKERLIFRNTNSDREYRAIINYLRLKCPEMQTGPDKISWRYSITKNRKKTDLGNEMAASVCYDSATMEPVGFSGIYFANSKEYGIWACGIVMYINPRYRRMGIAQTFYTIQEEKLRDNNVRYNYEIQIGGNVQLSDKLGYILLNPGRQRKDGRMTQVRYLIDANTEESKQRFASLPEQYKNWKQPVSFEFIDSSNEVLKKILIKNKREDLLQNMENKKEQIIDLLNIPWENNK